MIFFLGMCRTLGTALSATRHYRGRVTEPQTKASLILRRGCLAVLPTSLLDCVSASPSLKFVLPYFHQINRLSTPCQGTFDTMLAGFTKSV